MGTLRSIFNCIHDRILDNISWVNDVKIYQQQDIFQNESLGYKPPTVFVDFTDIEYFVDSYKVQRGTMNVVIKLVVEEYTKNYLNALDKKELLNAKLHQWGDWGSELIRVTESTDTDADSLYVFEMVYETSFFEEIYTDELIPMGGTNGTWGLCLDLQIDAFNLPSPESKIFKLDKCLSEPVFIDYVADITTIAPISSSFTESRTGRSYIIKLEDHLTSDNPIIVSGTNGFHHLTLDPSFITAATSGVATIEYPLIYATGSTNSIIPDFGGNTNNSSFSSILGGESNDISSKHAIIGGGQNNAVQTHKGVESNFSVIVGGKNILITESNLSIVGGGESNILNGSDYSSILGGQNNNSAGFDNVHIIGSNITADKANVTYLEEARFNSSLNTTVISDSNSGFRVESGSAVTISTDGIGTTSNFSKAWNYMSSSSNWLGMGGNGGNGTAISVQDNGVNKSATIFVDNIAVITSASNNIVTAVTPILNTSISSNNVTLNGALYNNSVALGGTGLIVDKDDYAFVENLEVQGGNLEITAITPSTSNNALTRDADNVVRVRENASFNGFMTFTDSVTTTSLTYIDLTKNYIIFQGSDLIGSPSQISFLMYMNTASPGGAVRIIDKTNGDALICEITGITSTSSNNIQTTTTITNIPTGAAKWAIQYHSATGATAKWRSCSILFG